MMAGITTDVLTELEALRLLCGVLALVALVLGLQLWQRWAEDRRLRQDLRAYFAGKYNQLVRAELECLHNTLGSEPAPGRDNTP